MNQVLGQIFELIKIAMILLTIITSLILILLSLPNSKLKYFLIPFFKWFFTITGVMGVIYILSPLDLLPDIIPLLGQIDDLGAVVYSILAGVSVVILAKQGRIAIDINGVPSIPQSPQKNLPHGDK